jgi:hypothetical protein
MDSYVHVINAIDSALLSPFAKGDLMEGFVKFITLNSDFYAFLVPYFITGSIEPIRGLHQRWRV